MYKRILVAIDSSSTAARALDEAINLAKALGASLCIAHASDEGPLTQHGMGLGSYIDIEKVKVEIGQSSNEMLDRAVAKAAVAGCSAEKMHIESTRRRVAEMIVDTAREWNTDLIVVGTHGHRGFQTMLVGSVAENLTHLAANSLLLVRES